MLNLIFHPWIFAFLNMAAAGLLLFLLKDLLLGRHFFAGLSASWPAPSKIPLVSGLHRLYLEAHLSIRWPFFLVSIAVVAFFSFWFFSRSFNLVLSILATLLILGMLGVLLLNQKQKYHQKLLSQVPAFLQALANALSAGYSLPRAFEFIVNDLEAPLKPEIETLVRQLELQLPLPDALDALADRLKARDISFFVESTKLHYATGGNLIVLFKRIASLIEMRHKLEQDLKTFTAQGRISGLMIVSLWFISLLLFAVMVPTHLNILFHTSQGQAMLTVSLLLEAIGFYIIWKMTHFDFA